MNQHSLTLIGAGKTGKSIAKLLLGNQLISLTGILNRRHKSTQCAQEELGALHAYHDLNEIKPCDIIMIAVDDSSIAQVAHALSQAGVVNAGTIVFHLSGTYSSDVLAPLQAEGALIASVHPLRSFADPDKAIAHFSGTYCATDGDNAALSVLIPLFTQIGATPFTIDPADKGRYHAASVFAANFPIALYHIAQKLYAECGINAKTSHHISHSLMQGVVTNAKDALDLKSALTGPLARGDTQVIDKHLAALDATPELRSIYVALSEQLKELLDL